MYIVLHSAEDVCSLMKMEKKRVMEGCALCARKREVLKET